MAVKNCAYCGKKFVTKTNTKTCSVKCRAALYRNRDTCDKKKVKGSLEDDLKSARELGISYGMYKANQYLARQEKPEKKQLKKLADYSFRKQQFDEAVQQYLSMDGD